MLKQKMMAFLLLLTMVFTCFTGFAVAYADDGVDSGYQDYVEDPSLITNVSNADYDKAVEVLKALGIVDADAKSENVMTRGEFAQFILQVLNVDTNLDNLSVSTRFSDVPEDHPNAAAIQVASSLGLMNGVETNLFEPDSEITYEQAVKVIVCALGYGVTVEKGASIQSYISIATQLKLLTNIKESYNTSATVGLASKIVYNALEVKMLRPTKAGIISEYSTQDNKTILEVNDIILNRDVINETYITALTGISLLKEDQVKIGDSIYYTGTVNVVDYLGYRVNAYAKKDTTKDTFPTLLYVDPIKNKNETLVITEENFAGIVINNDKSRTISYYDADNNLENTTISTSADILYQGLADPTFPKELGETYKTLADYVPKDSIITLIDNNGDGDYDIMSIKDYTSIVVDNVSLGTFDVIGTYCGDSHTVRLDANDSRTHIRILKGNEEVNFNAIKKDNVLSYVKSKDKKGDTYIEAVISENTFKGTVEAVYNKLNTQWITVNGNDHKLSIPYAEKKIADKKPFKPGATGTFYVSFNDKIVGYKVSGVNGYAFVIDIKENKGLSGTVALKLLTSTGEIQEYSTETSLFFDKSDKAMLNLKKIPAKQLLNNENIAKIFNEVILFKLNAAGNITEILSKDNEDKDPEAGLSEYAPLASRIYSKDVPCLYTTTGLEDSFMIDPKAIIFRVPDNSALTDDFRFSVVSSGSLTHNNEYNSEIFNVDEKMCKTTLVLIRYKSGGTSIDRWAEPNMVDTVSLAASDDGEIFNQLTLWAQGGKVVYKVTNQDYVGPNPKDLKKGDIIRFATDSEGQITTIESLTNFSSLKNLASADPDMGGEPTTTVGQVKNIEGSKVALITNSKASGIIRHFDTRGLPIVIYDTSAKTGGVSMGTIADVGVNDVMFIRSSDAWVTHLIVYKNVFNTTED